MRRGERGAWQDGYQWRGRAGRAAGGPSWAGRRSGRTTGTG